MAAGKYTFAIEQGTTVVAVVSGSANSFGY